MCMRAWYGGHVCRGEEKVRSFLALKTRPPSDQMPMSKAECVMVLDRLAWASMMETFLAHKFSTTKRFGLEGAETLVPGLKALIDSGAELGLESVVIGMPHRGELGWGEMRCQLALQGVPVVPGCSLRGLHWLHWVPGGSRGFPWFQAVPHGCYRGLHRVPGRSVSSFLGCCSGIPCMPVSRPRACQ